MNDLISRSALIKQIEIDSDGSPGWYGDTWQFMKTIAKMPSADAVQGEWIITKEGEYDGRSVYKTVCSECGHETFYKANKAHFCPNCGADMRGKE